MSESIEQKIDRFVEFNLTMLETACCRKNLQVQATPAKILICSLIDSLSKSRFPEIKKNGDRFISVIEQSSGWIECNHVSLLHLKRALEVEEHDSELFLELTAWLSDQLHKRFAISHSIVSAHRPISLDPTIEEVSKVWPKDAYGVPMRLGGVKEIKALQHKSLLWRYRNALVHEYRLPGRGHELIDNRESEPFYQVVSEIEDFHHEHGLIISNRWELVYPLKFLESLFTSILYEVAAHHRSQQSSPFTSYSEGSYWIPWLNDE